MSNVAANLRQIIANLEAAIPDAEKFDRGVNAPGTRVRKASTEAGKALKALRDNVSDERNSRASE